MSEKNERIIWVLYLCQDEVLVNKNTLILLPPLFLRIKTKEAAESQVLSTMYTTNHISSTCVFPCFSMCVLD